MAVRQRREKQETERREGEILAIQTAKKSKSREDRQEDKTRYKKRKGAREGRGENKKRKENGRQMKEMIRQVNPRINIGRIERKERNKGR